MKTWLLMILESDADGGEGAVCNIRAINGVDVAEAIENIACLVHALYGVFGKDLAQLRHDLAKYGAHTAFGYLHVRIAEMPDKPTNKQSILSGAV